MSTDYNSTHTGDQVDEAVDTVLNDLGTAALLDAGSASGVADLDSGGKVPIAQLPGGTALGVATLDSGGKIPTSQLPAAVLGDLQYQGVWNATTNTSPAIVSSVGTQGWYYKVSVAGTTDIDGIAEWNVGDWIVFNGATWDKVDNTAEDATTSLKGTVKLANDLGGTAALPEVNGASKSFAFKGVTTPSNLANGTTSDYAPTGIADLGYLRIGVAFGGTANLTGITTGAVGRLLVLEHISTSSGTLILKHDTTSTAANRFYCPSALDLNIPGGSAVILIYDATISRWMVCMIKYVSTGTDLSGTASAPTVNGATGSFLFKGLNSPAQIAADQNDYAPSGINTTNLLRINSDAARTITGINAAGQAGMILIVANVGSFAITLSNQDTGTGTASRRFDFGENVVLPPSGMIILIYDTTTSRWRAVGASIFLQKVGGTISGALTVSGALAASTTLAVTGRTTLGPITNTQSVLTFATTTDIDFDLAPARTVALTDNVTFTTSNRAVGKMVKLKLLCDGTPRNFTFPAWIPLGAALPASIAAGKTAILSLECWGTADTDITAAYIVQP